MPVSNLYSRGKQNPFSPQKLRKGKAQELTLRKYFLKVKKFKPAIKPLLPSEAFQVVMFPRLKL